MVSAFQEGKFLADPEARGKPRPNPMSDPAAMEGMMGMMKGNMAMMIPQTLIMGWINAFFSGFVISKSDPVLLGGCRAWPISRCSAWLATHPDHRKPLQYLTRIQPAGRRDIRVAKMCQKPWLAVAALSNKSIACVR